MVRRKAKITVSYQRVKRRPRKKHPRWTDALPFVSRLSPLARYVEENLEDGITVQELIHQFQEYDCKHSWVELCVGTDHILDHCEICRKMKRKTRHR